MRSDEEGNSNRDCRSLALTLAEVGLDFGPESPEHDSGSSGTGQNNNDNNTTETNGEQQGASNSNHVFSRTRWSRQNIRRSRCSRHRHRSRRNSLRRGLKQRECNFAAAVCSMVAVVAFCTSLAEPPWFRIIGGQCNHPTLGLSQFFGFGTFTQFNRELPQCREFYKYKFVYAQPDCSSALTNCVNMEAVQILKVIIVMCFMGALLSLVACILDTTGPTSPALKATRRNAVCNLLTVVCAVVIVGLCYWVSEIIAAIQKETSTAGMQHIVSVQFDISFYLVTAAGGISVIASAFNLLKKRPIDDSQDLQRLLDDIEHSSTEPATLSPDYYAPMLNIPPPPAYSP